uniref:Uncharacterized protein n=1 Tax=Rhizophora mucronata TaxID=61149 RepID=A0A2P2N2L8_RHIMU
MFNCCCICLVVHNLAEKLNIFGYFLLLSLFLLLY